ncbi:MAG: ABC transporter substrate-binding protein [Beijerinckiaceae bacterium]
MVRCVIGAILSLLSSAALAEISEIRAAQQYGLSYLALMLMEDGKLVEKEAERLGIAPLKVAWVKLGSANAMNDALLSGNLDFASGGVPNLITLWAKTRNTPMEVRGVAALNDMPVELVTSNPAVKTVRDFTEKDKIAVTAIKISTQALLLQMAAAKEFGQANFSKLDALTVSMPHPEAMNALYAGAVTAHFSSPPFQYQEIKHPGIHAVLNNYDLLGGKATFNLVWAPRAFHDANPKAYAAFLAALESATEAIRRDKRAAAETYRRMTGTKETVEELAAMLDDPNVEMTMTPHKTMRTAEFMSAVGTIKSKPQDWRDLWFPEIHPRDGS